MFWVFFASLQAELAANSPTLFFCLLFYKQLVADFFCLETQRRLPLCTVQNDIKKQGRAERITRKRANKLKECGSFVWLSDSGQVGCLASQSNWPHFRHERLLESRMTEAYNVLISSTHTNTLQRNSPWGLTARAANNLLKLNDMKVATQFCKNTMVIWGNKLSITCLFMGCVTFTMCSFIHKVSC